MVNRYIASNKVTILSIILNIFLAVIKIFSGIVGNSFVIIADGLHSASDIVTSIGILIGNSISIKPHDYEHPYGHEKAETIISFILSTVLIIVALDIGFNGIKALFNINKIGIPTILPLIVSIISIAIKEFQYHITIKVANKTNSLSLKADAWHHRSDALSSIAAFIGIGGAMLGYNFFDPIASILVAIIVIYVGIDIFKTSCDELMDRAINIKDLDKIKKISEKTKGINKIREIKSRKHGSFAYIDMIIQVDSNTSLSEAHEIAHSLEENIIKEIEYIKAIHIHTEPF